MNLKNRQQYRLQLRAQDNKMPYVSIDLHYYEIINSYIIFLSLSMSLFLVLSPQQIIFDRWNSSNNIQFSDCYNLYIEISTVLHTSAVNYYAWRRTF